MWIVGGGPLKTAEQSARLCKAGRKTEAAQAEPRSSKKNTRKIKEKTENDLR